MKIRDLNSLLGQKQAADKNQQAAFLCSFHTRLSGFHDLTAIAVKLRKVCFSTNEAFWQHTRWCPSKWQPFSECFQTVQGSNWEVKKWKFRKKPNTWPTYGSSSCKSLDLVSVAGWLSAHRERELNFSVWLVSALIEFETQDPLLERAFLCGKKNCGAFAHLAADEERVLFFVQALWRQANQRDDSAFQLSNSFCMFDGIELMESNWYVRSVWQTSKSDRW